MPRLANVSLYFRQIPASIPVPLDSVCSNSKPPNDYEVSSALSECVVRAAHEPSFMTRIFLNVAFFEMLHSGSQHDLRRGGVWVQICVSFPPTGDNRLIITPSSVSGQPTLKIASCHVPWGGGAITIPIPLPALDVGQHCEAAKDCESCIAKSQCGWCETGGANRTGACVPGDDQGPLCGLCGDSCDCAWQHGSCVIPEAQLLAKQRQLKDVIAKERSAEDSFADFAREISRGAPVTLGPTEDKQFMCATDALRTTGAVTTAIVTILLSLVLGGSFAVAGLYAGKEGLLEQAWERIKAMRRGGASASEGLVTNAAQDGSYMPPAVT
jgi:hypothetical protein